MFIFLNYLLASNIARKLSSGESDYLWWMLKGRSWPECFSLCQIVWSEYYLEALRGKTGIWYRNKSKIWQRLNGNNQFKKLYIYLFINHLVTWPPGLEGLLLITTRWHCNTADMRRLQIAFWEEITDFDLLLRLLISAQKKKKKKSEKSIFLYSFWLFHKSCPLRSS